MASVYVDTNIYLNFYRESGHSLEVFQDLRKLGNRLLFTQQTILEFERNRAKVITQAIDGLSALNFASSLPAHMIRALPEYAELTEARKRVATLIDAMKAKLKSYAADDGNDPVLTEFRALTASARTLPTTRENVQRAHERKLLGHPPSSDDKATIGDELIWETLLDGCADDLVICTHDKTFRQNEPVLRGEFQRRHEMSLTVSGDLAAVVRAQGQDDSLIKKEEEALAEQRRKAADVQASLLAASQALRSRDDYLGDGASFIGSAGLMREDGEFTALLRTLRAQNEAFENSEFIKAIRARNEAFENSEWLKKLRAQNEALENSEWMKTLRAQKDVFENSEMAKTLRAYRQHLDNFENSEWMKSVRAYKDAMEKSGAPEALRRMNEFARAHGLKLEQPSEDSEIGDSALPPSGGVDRDDSPT